MTAMASVSGSREMPCRRWYHSQMLARRFGIPREAVQTLDGETVVFIPTDHGFQALEVELGLADNHSVEIKSGLHPGDRYVATGAFALKAQMVTSGMDPHAGHGH